jgi:hypothetical protein
VAGQAAEAQAVIRHFVIRSLSLILAISIFSFGCASPGTKEAPTEIIVGTAYLDAGAEEGYSVIVLDGDSEESGFVICIGEPGTSTKSGTQPPASSSVIEPSEWIGLREEFLRLRPAALAATSFTEQNQSPSRWLMFGQLHGTRVGCYFQPELSGCKPDFVVVWTLVESLAKRCNIEVESIPRVLEALPSGGAV